MAGVAGFNASQYHGNMDALMWPLWGLALLIVLFLAVWAIRERGRHAGREEILRERAQLFEEQATSRALALQDQDQELARVYAELDQVREERDAIEGQFRGFVALLVRVGVLRPGVDPLAVDSQDLVYEISGPVPKLPVVNIEQALMLRALRHAAEREGPRSDRPFSRRYMVNDGPLTRTQFEALRGALVAGEYLREPDTPRSGYALTDKGAALLRDVERGLYDNHL